MLSTPAIPPHVYLHVPFCASKCSYCDFFSLASAAPELVEGWLANVVAQTREWVGLGLPGTVETVYIGGGTPTLPEMPVPLVAGGEGQGETTLPLAKGAEVTMEANPDSLDDEALLRARYLLVNRLSIGVQTFDDAELAMLGRRHDAHRARRAVRRALAEGFEVSIDLMCGSPGQSLESWERTLEEALETGVRHVSVYPLSVEDATPLADAIACGSVPEPDPDLAAEMMVAAEERLSEAGLSRYEVASYAVPGHECRHNIAYWTGRPYVALGPGAHGMLDAATASEVGLVQGDAADRVRYWYEAALPGPATIAGARVETLDAQEAAREDVMLGLRLAQGVPEEQVEDARLVGTMTRLADSGLVELVDGRWRTTRRGWLLGNEVYRAVWAGE